MYIFFKSKLGTIQTNSVYRFLVIKNKYKRLYFRQIIAVVYSIYFELYSSCQRLVIHENLTSGKIKKLMTFKSVDSALVDLTLRLLFLYVSYFALVWQNINTILLKNCIQTLCSYTHQEVMITIVKVGQIVLHILHGKTKLTVSKTCKKDDSQTNYLLISHTRNAFYSKWLYFQSMNN